MNDLTAPERVVAAWFEQDVPARAPEGLLDDILRTTSGSTPRPGWLAEWSGHHVRATGGRATRRLWAIAVVAAALLAVVAGAALIGSGSLGLIPIDSAPIPSVPSQPSPTEPARTETPRSTSTPASASAEPGVSGGCNDPEFVGMPAAGATSLASARQTLHYNVPAGLRMKAVGSVAYISFRDTGAPTTPRRGVDVSDLSDAVLHGSLVFRPYLGTDAASFLEDLGNTPEYTVTDVAPSRLGADLPALEATVAMVDPAYGWTHIDRLAGSFRGCALEFGVPHRLLLADVGESTIGFQIWAGTEQELDAWLPTATELVNTFRFEPAP